MGDPHGTEKSNFSIRLSVSVQGFMLDLSVTQGNGGGAEDSRDLAGEEREDCR